MALFTIWEGDESGITLWPGPGPPAFADGTPQEPAAVKVLEFEARSWAEAIQRRNDRYGWGEYRDDGGWPEIGPDEEQK